MFMQATINELRAQVVDLEQRVRVSETRESELKAKLADLEQRVGASDTIDELKAQVSELEQRVGVSETRESELKAKLADLEQRVGESDTIDELRAQMTKLQQRLQLYKDELTVWRDYGNEAGPKANAWDKYVDFLSDSLLEDAIGFDIEYINHIRIKTPRQKMRNLARLVDIDVQPTDTYMQIRKKLLLETHPDKCKGTPEQALLYEKIIKKIGEMPTHV